MDGKRSNGRLLLGEALCELRESRFCDGWWHHSGMKLTVEEKIKHRSQSRH